MSVRITRMCIPTSYARYSAAVRAIRGVINRSTAGSSARFKKRTARRSAPVHRLARAAEDAAEHLPRHVQFDRFPEELHRGLTIDPGSPLEHLHDDDVLRRIEDLPSLPRSVWEADFDELSVSDPLRLLNKDQRPRDLRNRPVFRRHLRWPPVA